MYYFGTKTIFFFLFKKKGVFVKFQWYLYQHFFLLETVESDDSLSRRFSRYFSKCWTRRWRSLSWGIRWGPPCPGPCRSRTAWSRRRGRLRLSCYTWNIPIVHWYLWFQLIEIINTNCVLVKDFFSNSNKKFSLFRFKASFQSTSTRLITFPLPGSLLFSSEPVKTSSMASICKSVWPYFL